MSGNSKLVKMKRKVKVMIVKKKKIPRMERRLSSNPEAPLLYSRKNQWQGSSNVR